MRTAVELAVDDALQLGRRDVPDTTVEIHQAISVNIGEQLWLNVQNRWFVPLSVPLF
jgi:hypothetical protein